MYRHILGAALAASPACLPAQMPAMPGMAMPPPRVSGAAAATMGDGISAAGSGTARVPAGDRMAMLMHRAGDWMLMAHGYAWGSVTDQGGRRGASQAFVQSMAMVEASRPLSRGVGVTLRGMISADPLMGERGYPDLFASGESAHGLALIDRQHPHDLVMELSGRIDLAATAGSRAFVYAGLPGEPALGPSAFMHRAAARFDPEAPITHHWFDSTHITYGVVTAGWAAPRWQVEASAFRGREPDEERYDIEPPRLDSWAVRGTWTPAPAWSASLSYGRLHSPEALHPAQDERRLIATAGYSAHGLDVTAAWSRKAITPGRVLPAWFVEATWALAARHALFGRVETVRNDELFAREEQLGLPVPLGNRAFRVRKFTAGYAYTLPIGRTFALALGGAASVYAKPADLDAAYGRAPRSVTLFAKLMLGR